MTTILKRYSVSSGIEEQILTGLIVSTRFCHYILPILDMNFFTVDYIRKVAGWVRKFFNEYGKCPDRGIESIFAIEKDKLKEEDAQLVEALLISLSEKYEQEGNFNADYLRDKAMEYFTKRAIAIVSDRAQRLLDQDKIVEAEIEIQNYKKIMSSISPWVKPLNAEVIRHTLLDDNRMDQLFCLPGALGNLIGPFERSWLVGILGPMKRCKSFFLQEIAFHALFARLKVAIFSLEMSAERINHRLYKRMMASPGEKQEVVYPCFDCDNNQKDICILPTRTNKVRLRLSTGIPKYDKALKYRPCTACRGDANPKIRNHFVPVVWYSSKIANPLTVSNVIKVVKGTQLSFSSNNLQIRSYPANSAGTSRIKSDLDGLEYSDGFIPDVIIVDYADILAPDDTRVTGRDRLDDIWKMLKNMADERYCLVVTASQANRKSMKKRTITQADAAEDIRKVAHVDAMISLNQLESEKRMGVMRVGLIAHRDRDFDQYKHCMVLQQLDMGQPFLDSEIITEQKPDKEEEDTRV